MKKSLAVLALLSIIPALLRAEDSTTPKSLQIDKIAVGTAVESKELMGTATEFDSSITRIYCWTKVVAANPPSKVTHIWYADGKKEAEVPLPINYSATRTWSSKNVWPGNWKVDVMDEAGSVLSSVEFGVHEKK